jgi:hypothetical protein
MGVVYEAEDLNLHRHVVLKLLPDRLAIGEEGHTFIVMELMEGQTLKQRIAGKPMETEKENLVPPRSIG